MTESLERCPASKTVTADSRGRVLTRLTLDDQESGCRAPLAPRWTRVRADGTWSVAYRVQRILPTDAWPSGHVDCAGPLSIGWGNCQMVMAVLDSKGRPDHTFGLSSEGEPHGGLEFATP